MGAVLGCCGGPSTDYDAALFLKTSPARYHPLLGRCDAVEKSLLGKLQRSLSASWSARLVLGDALGPTSPHTRSGHTGSRYGLDERYESESESDTDDEPSSVSGGGRSGRSGRGGATRSIASATSGSRLLCDFYNLVLECDHSKFFVDAHGRRVKGAYLKEVEILDDYFDTTRRTTVGARRRRRSSVDVLPYQPHQPSHKLKHLGANAYYDRSSNMSLMSNDTNETMTSESDYWATFRDAPEDPIDLVTELTFPPKYGSLEFTPYGLSHGRARRDSADRRRLSVLHAEHQLDGNARVDAAASSLLLFSPVHATTIHEPALPRQRSPSRSSSMQSPHTKPLALPNEGSRYNLWDVSTDDETSGVAVAKAKAVVPTVFSNAAVSERRRASLTMGTTNASTGNANRRTSLHSIAPIAV